MNRLPSFVTQLRLLQRAPVACVLWCVLAVLATAAHSGGLATAQGEAGLDVHQASFAVSTDVTDTRSYVRKQAPKDEVEDGAEPAGLSAEPTAFAFAPVAHGRRQANCHVHSHPAYLRPAPRAPPV